MVEPLASCGRVAEAEATARRVLGTTNEPAVAELARRGLTAVLGLRGDFPATIAVLREHVAVGDPDDVEVLLSRALAAEMAIITGVGDRAVLVEELKDVLVAAERHRDERLRCLLLQTLGVAASLDGDDDDAVALTKSAADIVRSGRVGWRPYLATEEMHAMTLLQADRLDEALTVATAALARAEQSGATTTMPLSMIAVGGALFVAGRWDEATPVLEATIELVEEVGNRGFMLVAHSALAEMAHRRGDPETADRWLQAADDHIAAGHSPAAIDWVLGTKARLLDERGDPVSALQLAELGWQLMTPLRHMYGYRRWTAPLVSLAVAAGRTDLAEEVVDAMDAAEKRSSTPSGAAVARHCRGLLEDDTDLLIEAADLFRETPHLVHQADCLRDVSRSAFAHGRRNEGIAAIDEAIAVSTKLGAAGDVATIEELARSNGIRRRGTPPPARPTTGWESLTPAEREIAGLVAEGLTNPAIGARLYISRRTVESHLSHIFTKCGFTNRAQLAAEVSRRTLFV
jgi:DNA-binding CsgD family transcriptional regulator